MRCMGESSLAVQKSPPPVRPRDEASDADERMRRFVVEHYDFVWRVLRRLGVPVSVAEDATQDVFIVVDRKARASWPEKEKSYLFAIALRVAAERRRAEHAQPEHLTAEAWAEIQDAAPGPDVTLDDRRARAVVDEILDLLPFEQRVVFVLFELEDMTMQEIAEALAIPSGTVASRLRLGRKAFRQAVRRFEAHSSAGGGK
jgi:RNA polymerase sigma-70 factor, ECF subfamily